MVVTDLGDDGGLGFYDICAIEAATESCFYYCDINCVFGEVIEGEGGEYFEEVGGIGEGVVLHGERDDAHGLGEVVF